MEFPDLGQNCSHIECKRLDFLPMKCDLCLNIYCLDHFRYESHLCPKSGQKDNQVPICPLCNRPVAVKRGQLVDIGVSQHIDLDCESDPAIRKRKQIFKNKCSVKGCKQKELMPLLCTDCRLNHCLKHRHPADHNCSPTAITATTATNNRSLSKTASAALKRFEQNKGQPINCSTAVRTNDLLAVQGNYTEDEALARALQQSMLDDHSSGSGSTPTQYDRDLAKAIADSERDVNRNKDKCSIA